MDDNPILNARHRDLEQKMETDLIISTEHLKMLLRALDRTIYDFSKQFPDVSFSVKDRYGVTVRSFHHGSYPILQPQNSWLNRPIFFCGRIFGSISLSRAAVGLSDLDLAKIALSLTEIVEWVETESERRGVKVQKILKDGINPETTYLLSLCGLREESGYTVIAIELTIGKGKFLFIDVFRRFMLMRAWGYQDSFDFLAYWSGGILVIYRECQKEHWTTRVEQWFSEWNEYQLQLSPKEPLVARACITTIGKLKELDTVLHDVQMTMETATKLNLSGLVDIQVNRFSHILSNLPEHILLELVHQTLDPILSQANLDSLRTLWVFLLLNQNSTEAAQALFIHRNTLHYRIRHIEQLLHIDLHETKSISSLWIALQALELLESSGIHLLPDGASDLFPIVFSKSRI